MSYNLVTTDQYCTYVEVQNDNEYEYATTLVANKLRKFGTPSQASDTDYAGWDKLAIINGGFFYPVDGSTTSESYANGLEKAYGEWNEQYDDYEYENVMAVGGNENELTFDLQSNMRWYGGKWALTGGISLAGGDYVSSAVNSDTGHSFIGKKSDGTIVMGIINVGVNGATGRSHLTSLGITGVELDGGGSTHFQCDGTTFVKSTRVVKNAIVLYRRKKSTPPPQYTVSAEVNPTNAGSVSGTGTYNEGASCTLVATANSGYKFVSWSDGTTNPSKTFVVNGDISYTANFSTSHTLTLFSSPEEGGTTSGSGEYAKGSRITIRAIPNTNYIFNKWSDEDPSLVKEVEINEDMELTAYFTYIPPSENCNLVLFASPTSSGTVTGSGTYPKGSVVSISAVPADGYRFVDWNDGSTESSRDIVLNNDTTLTANFLPSSKCWVYLSMLPADVGVVTGDGEYDYGDTVVVRATVTDDNYVFAGWSNGVSASDYSFVISQDTTLTARFELKPIDPVETTIIEFEKTDLYVGDYIVGKILNPSSGSRYEISYIPSSGGTSRWFEIEREGNNIKALVDYYIEGVVVSSTYGNFLIKVVEYDSLGRLIKTQSNIDFIFRIPDTFGIDLEVGDFVFDSSYNGLPIAGYTSYYNLYSSSLTAPEGYVNHATLGDLRVDLSRGSCQINSERIYGKFEKSPLDYQLQLTAYISDSRNKMKSVSKDPIVVYGYELPTVLKNDIFRCDESGVYEEGGLYCNVSFSAECFDIEGNWIDPDKIKIMLNDSEYVGTEYDETTKLYSAIVGGDLEGTSYSVEIWLRDAVMESLDLDYLKVTQTVGSHIPLSLYDDQGGNVGVAFGTEATDAIVEFGRDFIVRASSSSGTEGMSQVPAYDLLSSSLKKYSITLPGGSDKWVPANGDDYYVYNYNGEEVADIEESDIPLWDVSVDPESQETINYKKQVKLRAWITTLKTYEGKIQLYSMKPIEDNVVLNMLVKKRLIK